MHRTPREVVREALREVGTPVLVTGVTTAAGFLALSISRIPGIREFGLFSLMGVALTVTAALTFAPALLAVLPLPARVRAESDTRLLDRLALRLGTLTVVRRPLVIGPRCSCWASPSGARRASSSPTTSSVPSRKMRLFGSSSRPSPSASAARICIQVMVEADEREEILEPANLAALREFQDWLEAQPEVGRTTSIVDYLMLLNRVFHDGDEAHFVVPERKRLAIAAPLHGIQRRERANDRRGWAHRQHHRDDECPRLACHARPRRAYGGEAGAATGRGSVRASRAIRCW